MKSSTILRQAKALIDTPEHWTRGWYAKDNLDHEIHVPTLENACAFCSHGAVIGVTGIESFYQFPQETVKPFWYLDQAVLALYGSRYHSREYTDATTVRFNDDPLTTHKMVMVVYDVAIAQAEADEAKESTNA